MAKFKKWVTFILMLGLGTLFGGLSIVSLKFLFTVFNGTNILVTLTCVFLAFICFRKAVKKHNPIQ